MEDLKVIQITRVNKANKIKKQMTKLDAQEDELNV